MFTDDAPLRFGVFMAPWHQPGRNPTLALRRDLELICLLDELGYDEVFIGEHHSGGVEIIASPELMIAAAAERTKRIRLGTGVSSVPYHHPLLLADRIVQLDHMTGGRVIFGIGPGVLATDAHMMGIDPLEQRHMMAEGFEAIMHLMHSDEPLNMKTSWFELHDAVLQLRPVQFPRLETATVCVRSPAGPALAGRFGSGLLSLAATDVQGGGFDFLKETWGIVESSAAEYGETADRSNWRVVAPMYIAETEALAREQVKWGLANTTLYSTTGPFATPDWASKEELLATTSLDDLIDAGNDSGYMVVGTPDMAKAQIQRLIDQTGGFGSLLLMLQELADYRSTRSMLELFATEVMPEFQHLGSRPNVAWDKLFTERKSVGGGFRQAQDKAIAEYKAQQDLKTANTTT